MFSGLLLLLNRLWAVVPPNASRGLMPQVLTVVHIPKIARVQNTRQPVRISLSMTVKPQSDHPQAPQRLVM